MVVHSAVYHFGLKSVVFIAFRMWCMLLCCQLILHDAIGPRCLCPIFSTCIPQGFLTDTNNVNMLVVICCGLGPISLPTEIQDSSSRKRSLLKPSVLFFHFTLSISILDDGSLDPCICWLKVKQHGQSYISILSLRFKHIIEQDDYSTVNYFG